MKIGWAKGFWEAIEIYGSNGKQLEAKISRLKKETPRKIKSVCRDMRLYINAVSETVEKLRELGAEARHETRQTEDGIDIVIHISTPAGT